MERRISFSPRCQALHFEQVSGNFTSGQCLGPKLDQNWTREEANIHQYHQFDNFPRDPKNHFSDCKQGCIQPKKGEEIRETTLDMKSASFRSCLQACAGCSLLCLLGLCACVCTRCAAALCGELGICFDPGIRDHARKGMALGWA